MDTAGSVSIFGNFRWPSLRFAVQSSPLLRIGYYGEERLQPGERHGCGLWPAGVAACLTAADAIPVPLLNSDEQTWEDILEGLHGVVLAGSDNGTRRQAAEAEQLCVWCQKHKLPFLGIDHGLHVLNTTHGGTVYFDLPRDLPEALQHRHPPERGLRHAINIVPDTHLAGLYGEGEVVVNSEHRRAVQRVARGFRICAQALDGVIEAIEFQGDWFALGVQWQPATATASGLDIQLFRGLVSAAAQRLAGVACAAA
jgi:gamma-glutamyl-gamma-aminobutyrate hydrolase PuuD